jgi:hypothetical protein
MKSAAKAVVLCAVLGGCGGGANEATRGLMDEGASASDATPSEAGPTGIPEPETATDGPLPPQATLADPTDAGDEPSPSAVGPTPSPSVEPDSPLLPSDTPADVAEPAVTWHSDIASLVSVKCAGCHTEGGIAPFSLATYQEAKGFGPTMKSVVDLGIMPPWGAQQTDECEPRFGFRDDLRLSPEEVEALSLWVEAGMPEGDPETAAPVEPPPVLELEDPALSLPLPSVTVTGPGDRFLCFSLDPELTEDLWVTASQVVPGNDAIVHHVLTFLDPGGESAALAGEQGYYECFGGPQVTDPVLLGAWAPGAVPFRTPEGVAMSFPAGSRLVVNVHYHPTGSGSDQDEGTRIDFDVANEEPLYDGRIVLIGNFTGPGALGELLPGQSDPATGPAFTIPAGASGHVETMRFVVPPFGVPEGIIWGVGTHMHYVGRDMRMTIERPTPRDGQPASECLVQTPDWDFDWQRSYLYDAPLSELPTAGPGDVLEFRCTYDNSLENAAVREALVEQGLSEPRDVVLGEETLDEMCLGVFAVAYPR